MHNFDMALYFERLVSTISKQGLSYDWLKDSESLKKHRRYELQRVLGDIKTVLNSKMYSPETRKRLRVQKKRLESDIRNISNRLRDM